MSATVPGPAGRDATALECQEWLPRLRAGESAAITWCFHRFAPALLTLAERLVGERADAEDVLQETFLALPRALAQYEDRGRFEAWLRSLVARHALIARRRDRRRREVAYAPESDGRVTGTGAPDGTMLLERALRSLSDPLRHVFVLRVLEGHSHAEIAALLSISIGTSEMRLSRALKALRGLLGDQS
jgi:RNA polymerase sigma-70 factor (ECF subfamily)